jgi:eukaryotic-like serine/threonine-protein kinase
MPVPVNREEFLDLVRKSGVLEEERLKTFAQSLHDSGTALDQPQDLASRMVRDGLLTHFQAKQILQGKWRRFLISGKYKLLELLGAGGMGAVYLCEHIFMRRFVALKVLPFEKIQDPSTVARFYREARAAGALDHPNIVRAYDIDQDDKIHFLVMEYVDGASLQEVVGRSGPMDPTRAAHYIKQAALGLQHAHEAGLVHRDVKPGNLLLDRAGTVKVLDLGLARFFNAPKDNRDNVTEKFDEKAILGTADYLAPEQAIGNAVDIRADVYSLGATFYYLLTGKAPFEDGTITQKLLWSQTKQPKSIRELRPDVPEGMVAVIEKMMAKQKEDRHPTPHAVAEALAPWTHTPIPPPPEAEMPKRSLAARDAGAQGNSLIVPSTPVPRSTPSAVSNRAVSAAAPAAPSAARNGTPSTPAPRTPQPLPTKAGGVTARQRPAPASGRVAVAVSPPPRPRARARRDESTSHVMLYAAIGGGAGALLFASVLWFALSEKKSDTTHPTQPTAQAGRASPPTMAANGIVPVERVDQYIDQKCTVEMTVRYVGKATTAERYFLNAKEDYRAQDNFTVTFTKGVIDQLKAHGITDVKAYYTNKTVHVTGTVTKYNNRPQIEIESADQIQVVGS